MNDQTWIFGKAISPLFADRVTYMSESIVSVIGRIHACAMLLILAFHGNRSIYSNSKVSNSNRIIISLEYVNLLCDMNFDK